MSSILALIAQSPTPISAVPETTFDVPANVVFAVTAIFMIAAAIRVVTTKNIVHAALWLVIVLGGVGINYLLLQAEFVAITQFLVYLGAIIVLFLFGIMLTRAPLGVSDDLDNNQRWLGLGAAALLLVVVGYSLIETFADDKLDFRAYADQGITDAGSAAAGRTGAVADTIFGQYLIPFEMISVLLLAALIGAIVLARRD
jgi:NADH-quinone oxidoreductase subunit J